MTSVNTNAAAITALRTLQQTNATLDKTQSRISTGYKIGEAKDNAAYWSISTTLKSDNKALSTVKDALGLGAATVDTAYQGLNKTLEVLDEIKKKLTAATQAGVDRDTIQGEIGELQKQLQSISNSATFSGENWLSVDSSASGFATTKNVVSSFNRSASGAVTIGTVSVDITNVKLYDASTAGGADGLLDKDRTSTANGYSRAVGSVDVAGTQEFDDAADKLEFTVTQSGVTKTVSITQQTFIDAGLTDTTTANYKLASIADFKAVYTQALKTAGVNDISVNIGTDKAVSFTSSSTFSMSAATPTDADNAITATKMGLANSSTAVTTASGSTITGKVSTVDISTATLTGTAAQIKAKIEGFVSIVSMAITDVTKAASNLGAVASRIDLQKSFVDTLMDTIEKGVSGLVDADMSEESTKLQALQVKQQLGTQALSIANQSAQNILSLFQN